jgi:hypothetical protein
VWIEDRFPGGQRAFELEGVQARRFPTLQNLVALASLSWVLLAAYQDDVTHLLHQAKRQKRKKALRFPFYSLLAGWQRLFAPATAIFYRWWRRPRQPDGGNDPPIRDLFARQPGLLAGVG